MVKRTATRAAQAGIKNIVVAQRDVLAQGYGLPDAACDVGLLFNILHGESPVELLRETARVVRPGGTLAVIHWRADIATPRGPTADIRPRAEQIVAWAKAVGGLCLTEGPFELPPYHYGLIFTQNRLVAAVLTVASIRCSLRSNSSSSAPSVAPHFMGGQGRIAARSPPRANIPLPPRCG